MKLLYIFTLFSAFCIAHEFDVSNSGANNGAGNSEPKSFSKKDTAQSLVNLINGKLRAGRPLTKGDVSDYRPFICSETLPFFHMLASDGWSITGTSALFANMLSATLSRGRANLSLKKFAEKHFSTASLSKDLTLFLLGNHYLSPGHEIANVLKEAGFEQIHEMWLVPIEQSKKLYGGMTTSMQIQYLEKFQDFMALCWEKVLKNQPLGFYEPGLEKNTLAVLEQKLSKFGGIKVLASPESWRPHKSVFAQETYSSKVLRMENPVLIKCR